MLKRRVVAPYPGVYSKGALARPLAITWARVELCTRYKSPSSVTRRELSIALTWLAHRPKLRFPPLFPQSRLGPLLGEG
eukprot:COSAG02_NODE_23533_length_715_cov_6.873377_1_plen_78_part_10